MSFKKITAAAMASILMTAIPTAIVQAESSASVPEQTPSAEQNEQAFNSEAFRREANQMLFTNETNEERPGDGELPPSPPQDQNFEEQNRPPMPQGNPNQAPMNIEGSDGELPPAIPEGNGPSENDENRSELPQMNENGTMPEISETSSDGTRPEMPEMNGENRPEESGMPNDMMNLETDNEEANTIIQQIRSLFQKLLNLFGKQTDNSRPNQNGNGPENMEENSGRPEMPGDSEMSGRPDGERPEGSGPEMNQDSGRPESFEAANTVTGTTEGETYASSADSENAVLVTGETAEITNAVITKTGSTSGENADFYGTNAAVLANNGASLTISDTTVTTDGTHANAIFSNGSGTSVNVSDTTITTTGNNSGGLMVTGGGSITASNLTVTTSGNSSAAIRSDRGGGTTTVTEGSYSTSGVGSPAIYSTADISVTGAVLSSSSSEAVVIEGGNSVTLTDCTVTGDNNKLNGQSTVNTNVLIYQSMSGDASEGASNFTMSGGKIGRAHV